MDKMMLRLQALVSFGRNRSCLDLTKQLMNENLIPKFVYTAQALAARHQSELLTIEFRWIFVMLHLYGWIIYVTNSPVALNVHGLPNSTFVDVQWGKSEGERLDHSDHVSWDNYRTREYDKSQIISLWSMVDRKFLTSAVQQSGEETINWSIFLLVNIMYWVINTFEDSLLRTHHSWVLDHLISVALHLASGS